MHNNVNYFTEVNNTPPARPRKRQRAWQPTSSRWLLLGLRDESTQVTGSPGKAPSTELCALLFVPGSYSHT